MLPHPPSEISAGIEAKPQACKTFKGLGLTIPPQPTDFETFLRPCNQRGLKGPSLDSHILHWMLDSASVKYAAKFLILFSEKFHRSTNNNIAQRSEKQKLKLKNGFKISFQMIHFSFSKTQYLNFGLQAIEKEAIDCLSYVECTSYQPLNEFWLHKTGLRKFNI